MPPIPRSPTRCPGRLTPYRNMVAPYGKPVEGRNLMPFYDASYRHRKSLAIASKMSEMRTASHISRGRALASHI